MRVLKTAMGMTDKTIIDEAVEVLASGGIVLYPTDTVYGLGANIFNNRAVRKIFKIKKRSLSKPLSVLVSDIESMGLVARISNNQREIINNYLPGSYTFILDKQSIIPPVITSGSHRVGVRVPDCDIARSLAKLFPITTTSANISDKEVLKRPCDIVSQLDFDIDLVIDAGPLKSQKASVIIDLTGMNPKILRR